MTRFLATTALLASVVSAQAADAASGTRTEQDLRNFLVKKHGGYAEGDVIPNRGGATYTDMKGWERSMEGPYRDRPWTGQRHYEGGRI